jgi:hypothetical protein
VKFARSTAAGGQVEPLARDSLLLVNIKTEIDVIAMA